MKKLYFIAETNALPHDHADEQAKTHQKVRIIFIAECDAEVLANACTIFGRPDMAEPYLREEFRAIVAAFFAGKVSVEQSAVAAVAVETPAADAA